MAALESSQGMVAGTVIVSCCLMLLGNGGFLDAQACDVDGDARVSLADVLNAQAGRPAADCFLEWVRRAVPGSLVPWAPISDFQASQPALPPDPRVVVWLESAIAPGGSDDRVRLVVWVESTDAFGAFGLVLDADGEVLGAPRWVAERWEPCSAWGWRFLEFFREPSFGAGDLDVSLSIPAYLVSRGRYVVTYGVWRRAIEIAPPGAYRVVLEARVPLGTRAGAYALRVLPGSEIVFADGTVVAPVVEEEASIVVEEDVIAGWGEGPVPLELDPERREVLGAIEFRLATASGEPREVVAEGAPGDPVSVLIQMRTGVPLNRVACSVSWPPGTLLCEGSVPGNPEIRFRSPEDALLYPAVGGAGAVARTYCSDVLAGRAAATFELAGSSYSKTDLGRLENRVLEYFKPLGVWTDVALVRLRIAPTAPPGEDIPLLCFPPSPTADVLTVSSGAFVPYLGTDPCGSGGQPWSWGYPGTGATGARIRVVEGPPPPPPPEYEIRVTLGDVAGKPGQVIQVPIFASASEPLALLRLALELDPGVARVDGAELVVLNPFTAEERIENVFEPDLFRTFTDCIDTDADGVAETCKPSQPFAARIYSTEDRYALFDILSGGEEVPYPGRTPRLIGHLRARISGDPVLGETRLVPASVPYVERGTPTRAISGGWKSPIASGAPFSPLKAYEGGRIRVEGFVPKRFLRGDSNGDGKVNISDAIATLGYLFLGSEDPGCLDAADANDSGHLDITDGIFLLGVLFLGAGTVPEPYPECGEDPTPDGLGCRRGCGAG